MPSKTLIIGAGGQIGSELAATLRAMCGAHNVITSDINNNNQDMVNSGPFEVVDAKNYQAIKGCVEKHGIEDIFLMAALLSATGEKYPQKAWNLNTESLLHVLNLAKEGLIKKVFWPSSIAVFGPSTPKTNTPQRTICEPTTVYGITKQVGERWCKYYHTNYGVDIRSIRYPGIISHKTMPGGGTTDYAVDIYHKALTEGTFSCFLKEDTRLPMMFMDDAIKGTLQLMAAPSESLSVRSSYNLGALSFTPKEIFETIKKHIPEFEISYKPDFRQTIADSWPSSIDDSVARTDWGWQHEFDLEKTTAEMLKHLRRKYDLEAAEV